MNIDLDEFFKEELAHARAQKPIIHGVTKYCNLCQFVKSVSEFYLRNSGMNRGMLCQNCNKALGLFKDSVARLEGAISYLIKYSAGLE